MLLRRIFLCCAVMLGCCWLADLDALSNDLAYARKRRKPHKKSKRYVRKVVVSSKPIFFDSLAAPRFNTQSNLSETAWVDSVFATLNDDQKIGQFFMAAVHPNNGQAHLRRIQGLIDSYGVGGVIFFKSDPYLLAQFNNQLQAIAKVPLLTSIDGEWGLAMRMKYTMAFPKQITLGAIQDNSLIFRMGQEIARQCKRLGIHLNFAPVVDINSNPNNPIIGHRSFGEVRENVAEKSVAYMHGMQQEQLIACAKHFPGHGDTHGDSHRTLPQLAYNIERLKEVELYPFQKLIQDSIKSMIVGHLQVPIYDWKPATLSQNIVTNLLKNEMGFKGLVITDALNMRGVHTEGYVPGGVDLQAFLAGNDILLCSENIPEGIRRIREAVLSGAITQAEVDMRVKKILRAKYWVGLHHFNYIETQGLQADLHTPEASSIRQILFNHAITLVKDAPNLVPLQTNSKLVCISVDSHIGNSFQQALGTFASFQQYAIDGKTNERYFNDILRKIDSTQTVVVSIHRISNSPYAHFGIGYALEDFIKRLEKKTRVIVCAFGNPYSLKYFAEASTIVCGYEDEKDAHTAVAEVLFGRLPAKGKLPVSVENLFKAGEGLSTDHLGLIDNVQPESVEMSSLGLSNIDTIIKNAIQKQVFPGCQLVVARKGQIVYNRNFGNFTYDNNATAVANNTIYDLASVTKVAATLQALMFLYDRQKFSLEEKISLYLPELQGTNKENLLIKDILWHQAGLVAYIPFWQKTRIPLGWKTEYYNRQADESYTLPVADGMYAKPAIRDSVWRWVIESPLRQKKGEHYDFVYSDLGLMMLQHLVEKLTGQPLDVFVKQTFYEPIGMNTTGFNPLQTFTKSQIAPTENDTAFRGKQVQGTVQDQTAAMLGGVSGHAGLFSSASDLAKLMQMNLNNGAFLGKRYFNENTVKYFAQTTSTRSHRALGWDKRPSDGGSSYVSSMASASSFGHSGYTGTLVWVDPAKDLVFVFLSNRVYPSASNNKINTLHIRRKIMDEVYKSLK